MQSKNQFRIVITADNDLTTAIYKLNPTEVTVVSEQEDNSGLFKQFLSDETEVIIMLFAVSHVSIWGCGSMSPLILTGGTKWK